MAQTEFKRSHALSMMDQRASQQPHPYSYFKDSIVQCRAVSANLLHGTLLILCPKITLELLSDLGSRFGACRQH